MSTTDRVLVSAGFVGLTATAAAVALVWLLITRPIALAQFLQQVL